MTDRDAQEFLELTRLERQRSHDAVTGFVDGAVSGDLTVFSAGVNEVVAVGCWREAMLAVSRAGGVADNIRQEFIYSWNLNGDHLRNEVGEDKILMDGLRQLLPSYNGAAVALYRGDSFANRKRRTYGLSWTVNKGIAEAFARGIWRTFDGGSVLLKTVAPPEAIICALPSEVHHTEEEYLVDRRQLTGVSVLERFQS